MLECVEDIATPRNVACDDPDQSIDREEGSIGKLVRVAFGDVGRASMSERLHVDDAVGDK